MAAKMKIGFDCLCCRKKGTRERSEASAELLASLDMCGSCEDAGVSPPDLSIYTLPLATGICALDASEAFQGLKAVERLYAYGLGKADWEGAKICLVQCSPESVPIFSILQLVFSAQPVAELVAAAGARGLDQTELDQAMMYSAAIYGNLGNYKSFGDTKIVPELPSDRMELFLTAGGADPAKVRALWSECSDRMYALPPRARQMGLGREKGTSTYFSSNCEQEDADVAGRFMESLKLSPYNTRLFKDAAGQYTVLLASAVRGPGDDAVGQLCRAHEFEGKTFVVQRGDHAPLMARVVDGLRQALPHVASDTQKVMLERYIESFELGSVAAHVEASKHWIGDIGPAVESYIGFIESYRDPSGARGEWEGFVACVNREVSKKFQALVDQSENLLKKFPWPPAFEKDVFMRPDFTSLDVLAFGCSGVPAGINIPNYDDVRQTTGFKNVSLGNVLSASYGTASAKPISFLGAGDQEFYKALQPAAFEVQVGVHELLGHGSGKVFMAEEAESLKDIENPLTGAKVVGPFYAPGATWDTVFGTIASSYEECRAECSGLYLCVEPEVLAVFGHEVGAGGDIVDVAYVNWLHMARAGLMGLEFYTPEVSKWRQAHMQGRYVILRVFLEAGQGFVTIREKEGADGKPDLEVVMDRSKIMSVGHPAIGNFLLKLQVHKSLGDFAAGSELYARYSEVPDDMLALRAVVMARKEPRKLMVQPHMQLADGGGDVELRTFPASTAGLVESFVARFPAEDEDLLALYEAEKPQHDLYLGA